MSDNNVGDVIRIRTNPPFSNEAGTPTDPTNVRLLVRRRSQPPTVYTFGIDDEITRDSAGTFHADVLMTKPGHYYARWEGDGAVTAAEEMEFDVATKF